MFLMVEHWNLIDACALQSMPLSMQRVSMFFKVKDWNICFNVYALTPRPPSMKRVSIFLKAKHWKICLMHEH